MAQRFRLGWSLLLLSGLLPAQTLAHKGWAGSGMTVDPWWKNAVFYQVDPLSFQDTNGDGFGDLNGITARLDYLQSLGVDALVLSPFQLQPSGAGKPIFEPVYGSEEDFDRLEQEASRHKMRLLVDLPQDRDHTTPETLAAARFWLTRGVGGLRLTPGPAPPGAIPLSASEQMERVRLLRRLCAGFVGDRVLLSDLDLRAPHASDVVRPRSSRPHAYATETTQLAVNRDLAAEKTWNRSVLLSSLSSASFETVLASDGQNDARSLERLATGLPQPDRQAVAKMVATALFLGRNPPLLYFGQEIGISGSALAPMQWGGAMPFTTGTPWIAPGLNADLANVALEDGDTDSLLTWYRTLGKLRHEQAALRGGSLTLLDTGFPEVVAWVRRGTSRKDQPVLAVCNLSPRPLLVSVADALHRLGLSTAGGVQALALSVAGMDPSYAAAGIRLPAYGVYVGGLHQPGLEDAPAPPPRARHRGR